MGKHDAFQSKEDRQYWQKHGELYAPKTYTDEIAKTKMKNVPCGACGEDHSKIKESQMYYDELFCGWCVEDMQNGRPLRRKKDKRNR